MGAVCLFAAQSPVRALHLAQSAGGAFEFERSLAFGEKSSGFFRGRSNEPYPCFVKRVDQCGKALGLVVIRRREMRDIFHDQHPHRIRYGQIIRRPQRLPAKLPEAGPCHARPVIGQDDIAPFHPQHQRAVAASSGQFEETWILPTGRTYRVTGHPHADGSLAFLFEDISTEIEMTQTFRSELQLSQTVIDTLDEAIAVFSAAGDMIMSNAAYGALWQVDPAATLGSIRILDAVRHWQAMALPNPAWGDIRDFVGAFDERADWFADAVLRDGRRVDCRVIPLQGGATLVGFSAHPALPPGTDRSQDKATRPATETI